MFSRLSLEILVFQTSTAKMTDPVDHSSSDPSCSSCVKLQEALEASKREHSLTLRMVKEKIISTDELIKKYQQKCLESEKNLQQATDFSVKLEAAQMKIDTLQSQLERSLHSTEPLRKNVTRLHREKTLADSSISELREKVQRLEKLNSELISTAKVKDEQECAWRLEKQVQAQEVQKQKTSLKKSEMMIGKLQEQLKKEKEQNKEISKSLAQANRKAAKLEQQLQKSKEEIESAKLKLDADLVGALEDGIYGFQQTPKLRQRRKTRQPAQPCKESQQHSSPVSHPNQHMAHVMQELKVLSDIGPVLSPLPPSPGRDTLESSSSSEESEINGEDDEKASDGGGSDSSLGDLADMIIGDNTELVASPQGTAIDTAICNEEIIKNAGDANRINSNADDGETEHKESLTAQTQNEFCASENMSLSNCVAQSNSQDEISEPSKSLEQGGILNQIDEALKGEEICSSGVTKTKEKDETVKAKAPSKESKFAAVPSSIQRKGKRCVTSPKPRIMTRSRTKAMKISVSSEGDSWSEKQTGKDLNFSKEHCSESSDIESRERNLSARNVGKLDKESVNFVAKADTEESHVSETNDQEVCSEEKFADSTCHHRNNQGLVHSAASLSSIEKEGTSGDISSELSLAEDAATNNNDPAKLDIGSEQELSLTSESGVNSESLDTLMEQRDDVDKISSVEVSNNNSDSASTLRDKEAITNKVNEQISPQDNKDTNVSKEISASQLQAERTVLQQKEATVEENNKGILEDVEDLPEQLAFDSVSALSLIVDTNSSKQNELPLQETHVVSSCSTENETSDLSKLSTTFLDETEMRLPEQVCSLSKKEVKAGSESFDETAARAVVSCPIKPPKDATPGEINSTGEVDVNHAITAATETSTETTRFSVKKQKSESTEDSNLAIREDVLMCASSMPSSSIKTSKDETSEIGSSSYVVTQTTTTTTTVSATIESTTMGSSDEVYKDGSSENALTDEVFLGTSSVAMQQFSVKEEPTENSKTENSQLEKTAKSSQEVDMQQFLVEEEPTENSKTENSQLEETAKYSQKEYVKDLSSAAIQEGNVKDLPSYAIQEGNVKELSSAAIQEANVKDLSSAAIQEVNVKELRSDAIQEGNVKDLSSAAIQEGNVKDLSSAAIQEGNVKELPSDAIQAGNGKDLPSDAIQEGNVKDLPSDAIQEVKVALISVENRKRADFESNNHTFRTTSKEAGKPLVPSLFLLDTESELQRTEPLELPLSPNKVDSPEKGRVNPDSRSDSPIRELISNLGDVIGDQFPTLSPLPPSPCPSCHASSVDDFVGDFPPLSPLPPSPSSVIHNVLQDSSIYFSDVSKQTQKCVSYAAMTGTSTQPPHQRQLTSSYTELSSKSIIGTSSEGQKSENIKKSDNRDNLMENWSAESKTGMFESNPSNEKKFLKRSFQQFDSEAAKGVGAFSHCKKMKAYQMVYQNQERSTLFKESKASLSSQDSVLTDESLTAKQLKQPSMNTGTNNRQITGKQLKHASKNIDANEGPLIAKQLKQPPKTISANDGSIIKNSNVNDSTKTAEPIESKYRPLSVRPRYHSEVQYVLKCLRRLHEDSVKINVVVERLTTKKCLSSCTPLASAIIKFLKQRQDDLIPQILNQFEEFQSDEGPVNWKPVKSGFETRLMDVLTKLCGKDTIFGNFIPQMVTLCSRSLISSCRDSVDDNFRGLLSLCRVLTSLCQLQEDLSCIRVACYDVMRSLYANQDAALELVVTIVTVWPEVLKTSSDCSNDKLSLLVRTLKMVLLNWAESSSSDLGNILRMLCCWGEEPVSQETMKGFGLQLIECLLHEKMASVCINKEGTLVIDRHSFELVKSLELLSCVLGWRWTMNELIINNIWKILQTWADEESDVMMDHSADVFTYVKQNEILEGDQSTSTRTKSTCSCQITSGSNEGLGNADKLSGVEKCGICSKCGNLTGDRLAESKILLCIQLLGVLCRVAIEKQQSAVSEITDLLCGLLEQTSNSKVTYAIHLAAAVSLLDMAPWQPKKVITVLGKWLKDLKESGSPQSSACVAQGLVCLKSIVYLRQNDS